MQEARSATKGSLTFMGLRTALFTTRKAGSGCRRGHPGSARFFYAHTEVSAGSTAGGDARPRAHITQRARCGDVRASRRTV